MAYDILALGECLVDIVADSALGTTGEVTLHGNPGGAPANVMAGAAKLGISTGFIGKLGNDGLGHYLHRSLSAAGVCTEGVIFADQPTTLAMVTLDDTGNRSFSFYRDRTADVMLSPQDINPALFEGVNIFHFGTVSLTAEPSRAATLSAVKLAREKGALISLDVNYRFRLWADEAEARNVIRDAMSQAQLLKLSDDELCFITEDSVTELSAQALAIYEQYRPLLLAVTMGAKGCLCVCGGKLCHSAAYDVPCVDTTGAGDAFWAALLSEIVRYGKAPTTLEGAQLLDILHFANAAGSLTTTSRGAIPAMPTRDAVERCVRETPLLLAARD